MAIQAGVDACVDWVTQPNTWADHLGQFPKNIGFDQVMVPQSGLPDGLLPVGLTGKMTRVWLIRLAEGGGVYVVGNYGGPLCNAAGVGPVDFEPGANALTGDADFQKTWEKVDTKADEDMVTERWQLRTHRGLALIISHAAHPNARTDRVQFLATVQLDLKDK